MSLFTADYRAACVLPSPNHGERIDGARPDIILLHYTGMPSEEGRAFPGSAARRARFRAIDFVHEDGRVAQLVPEDRRAWHAGKSFWAGETDINSRSIGIEIANAGHPAGLPAFADAQIEAVIELCRDCGQRLDIRPERVLGHSDVAPVRKVDPGENFPWGKLHAAGVGHFVEPVPVSGGRFFQKGESGQPIEALAVDAVSLRL